MIPQSQTILLRQYIREALSSLNLIFPNGFTFDSLVDSLLHIDPDPDLVYRAIEYLAKKQYVECTNPRSYPRNRRYYKLTASGYERANQMIEDPAIDP